MIRRRASRRPRRSNVELGWTVGAEETGALINAMAAQPPVALVRAIDDLIIGLKADGWWTEIGYLLIPTLHTEQASLLNWKNPGQSATNSAGTWTQYQGIAGNGTTSRLTTVSPTSVPGYTQNGANLFTWTEDGNIVANLVGQPASAAAGVTLQPKGGTNFAGRLNSSATATFGAVANRNGLRNIVRPDSVNLAGYAHGALVASVANTSAAVDSAAVTLLNPMTAVFANDRVTAFGIGGPSVADPADLHTLLDAFFDAIGTVHT